MALVLRAFHLYTSLPGREAPLVHVVGRKGGLISFILTLLRLQNETHLMVTPLAVELETQSLFGVSRVTVPLGHIASVRGGVGRPLEYAIAAIICITLAFSSLLVGVVSRGAIVGALLFSLIAAGCVVLYFLRKAFFVRISSQAGLEIAVSFLPSLLEARPIDFAQAMSALDVLRYLVVQGREGVPPTSSAPITPSPTVVGPAPVATAPAGPVGTGAATPWANPVFTGPESAASPPGLATPPVSTHDAEEEALQALRRAVITYNEGNREEGIRLLEEVVQLYPGTKAAKTAQGHLSKLGRAQ